MQRNEPKQDIGVFQVAVGAIIEHQASGEILLLKRQEDDLIDPSGYEPVYGRVNQFEDLEIALKREIEEETGLKNVQIVDQLSYWHIYRGEEIAQNEVIGLTFWCQTDTREVIISPEHQEFLWVTKDEALNLIKLPGVKKDFDFCINKRARHLELLKSDERAQRAFADYQNLLNRVTKAKQDISNQAGVEVVEQLLSPLSHLGLAAAELQDKGLDMVVKEFQHVLTNMGLKEIATEGDKFDPATMEAVSKDGKGEMVKKIVKQGYSFNDKVILHAKVIVG